MGENVLELRDICKRFGGIAALKNVSFSLQEGEVHALIGENGAGKSTLIKILTGVHKKDSGEILIKGKKVEIEDPVDARKKGISAIYQELSLIESLSVGENIFLGHELSGPFLGTLKRKELFENSASLLNTFGLKIDPKRKIADLGLGQKRIIEILKAISINSKILLLDEPTTGMSKAEIDTLFKIIDNLKERKVTMIYISHNLEEIHRVCDRVSVLRDGENAGFFEVNSMKLDSLVNAMLGRSLKEEFPPRNGRPDTEILLKAEDFQSENMEKPVSFELKKGEILGVTGIIGAGKSELSLGLFGASKRIKGKTILFGRETDINSPKRAKKAEISFVPEDRKGQGLFLSLSVGHNLNVSNIGLSVKFGIISGKKFRSLAIETGKKLQVNPLNLSMSAKNLSGGNQQKVVIGKWLCGSPKIFILDEPTRGIDIGAKSEIYSLINSLADQGAGVLIMSSEFREMNGICDRILVMRKGEFIAELGRKETSTEKIMTLALGG